MNGKYLVLVRLKRLNQIKLRLAHLKSPVKRVILLLHFIFLHQNSQNLYFYFLFRELPKLSLTRKINHAVFVFAAFDK